MKKSRSECPHGASDLPEPRRGLFRRALSSKSACEACGGREELRVCQSCGYVGCCESHEAHDTAHFEASGHPFIRPRVGRDWLWCYLCRAYLQD